MRFIQCIESAHNGKDVLVRSNSFFWRGGGRGQEVPGEDGKLGLDDLDPDDDEQQRANDEDDELQQRLEDSVGEAVFTPQDLKNRVQQHGQGKLEGKGRRGILTGTHSVDFKRNIPVSAHFSFYLRVTVATNPEINFATSINFIQPHFIPSSRSISFSFYESTITVNQIVHFFYYSVEAYLV